MGIYLKEKVLKDVGNIKGRERIEGVRMNYKINKQDTYWEISFEELKDKFQ